MRIERIRKENFAGGARVSADVTWERFQEATRTLYIETSEEFADDLGLSADAFLVAMMPLAQWRGEDRVLVEGTVCTRLRDGLAMAADLFASWYPRCGAIRIEPTKGFVPTMPRETRRTASFLSGGVDALSLLRSNRLEYPDSHPRYISDCLLVFGLNSFDFDASGFKKDRIDSFEAHARRMGEFAKGAGATLIPATSNVRTFYPDFATWGSVGFAAGIISVALCFGSRFDVVQLASVGLGTACPPGSTHPLLDEQFSTEAVQVRHAQPALSRMEKVRNVAAWPQGLAVLRSCFYHAIPEGINCGKCEKCVRTMLALLALGKLKEATTFPGDDVTPGMFDAFEIERDDTRLYYEQIAAALEGQGRPDLEAAIWRKVGGRRK